MNTPAAVHAAFALFRFPYKSMQIIQSNYISFFILFIYKKKLPYHHSWVLADGGLYLCRLGSKGRVTAASHQQGGVYASKKAKRIQHEQFSGNALF